MSKRSDENNKLRENMNIVLRRMMKERYYREKEMAETIGMKPADFYNRINPCTKAVFNLIDIKKMCDELLITIDELITEAYKECVNE